MDGVAARSEAFYPEAPAKHRNVMSQWKAIQEANLANWLPRLAMHGSSTDVADEIIVTMCDFSL
jgi:hypothetical protein